jgi:hypothetical protein
MISSAISIIDRLISLVEHRKQRSRELFLDHIEPIFSDLTQIHKDYIATLNEIAAKMLLPDVSPDELRAFLISRRDHLSPLRVKVVALATAIRYSQAEDRLKAFADSTVGYFRLATESNTTGYTSLLGIIDAFAFSTKMPKDHVRLEVSEVKSAIDESWHRLALAYGESKAYYLIR